MAAVPCTAEDVIAITSCPFGWIIIFSSIWSSSYVLPVCKMVQPVPLVPTQHDARCQLAQISKLIAT